MASFSRLSNRKEQSVGVGTILKITQCASIEEVLGDFAKIGSEIGIDVCCVKVAYAQLEREYEISKAGADGRKIIELAVGVEGGQTRVVVYFREPLNRSVIRGLECACQLAAHRIEVLAGGALRADQAEQGRRERSPVLDGIIGESELMLEVREQIRIAGLLDLSVLIIGEPGTGKELVARGIHNASSRAKKPFIAVNCAAFNPGLIESEIFGHEKGAFTGASARKIGRVEMADGGTLFLDEIGDLPPPNQAMLLRVLQERVFERVGGTQSVKANIRLVAATNHDLLQDIKEGRFRRDLYDRLCGYPIQTPSLRDHLADIPILLRHCFPFVRVQEEALELLCRYPWPGNVRELLSMVERLHAKAGSDRIITIDLVRREVESTHKPVLAASKQESIYVIREDETLLEYLGRIILMVYEQERARLGSHIAVAERLGMHRNTLYSWLKRAQRVLERKKK